MIVSLPVREGFLERPTSRREGDNHVLDSMDVTSDRITKIDLEVRSPGSGAEGEKAILYLLPEDIQMEEEP
jgi:hypothetical protein